MNGRLQGKKALVYGGGTGIGLAIAEALAREGASLFISSRREHVLHKDMGACRLRPGDTLVVVKLAGSA